METKYEAVKQEIKERLAAGNIRPGEKLPSIRTASALWNCSINTAIRAYQELEKST